MVRLRRTIPVLTVLLLILAFATSSARATTITQTDTCNILDNNDVCQTSATDMLATASVSLNTATNAFSLTFDLTNNDATNSATLVAYTLQLFDSAFTINPTLTTGLPSGWDALAGYKQNNSGDPSTCHTATGLSGWFCVTSTGTTGTAGPLTIGPGATAVFTFSGTLDTGNNMITPFDLLINGTYPNGVKYAISSSMSTPGGPPPHQLPEPASLLLIGGGFLGLSALVRRRLNS